MVYGDFKYLTRRTTSDETLRDKAFNIASKSENILNKELVVEDLHKPVMKS